MRNSIENSKPKEIQDPSFNEFIKIIKKIGLIFDGDLPEDVQDIDSLYSMIIKSVNEKLNSNIANIEEIVLVGELLSIPLIKLF